MKYGAQENAKISTPPSCAILWHARYGFRSIGICAKTWFEARAIAAVELHCEPGQVVFYDPPSK